MTHSHWLWAALGALAVWPIKHVWDNWIAQFWAAFWVTFKEGVRKTPGGQEFLKAYHEARAKKDEELAKAHPELESLLHCKDCLGKGCENCGGTGWV